MKNCIVIVISLISLLLISILAIVGCAVQPEKSTVSPILTLSPAEVIAGREAKTIITCSGLSIGKEIKIMVVTQNGLAIDETLSCNPIPEVSDHGEFSTSLILMKFSPGMYSISVADNDYNILSSATLRIK